MKPDFGRIKAWSKSSCDGGLGYLIEGEFLDHPHIRGRGHTSAVIAHNSETGEVETRNSRYRLVAVGEATRMSGWPWKGDKMKFLGKNGYDHEREDALKLFEVGAEYEVVDCDVGDWRHTVSFVGIPGRWNGVMFEAVAQSPQVTTTPPERA